jgi:hypothetical protein
MEDDLKVFQNGRWREGRNRWSEVGRRDVGEEGGREGQWKGGREGGKKEDLVRVGGLQILQVSACAGFPLCVRYIHPSLAIHLPKFE